MAKFDKIPSEDWMDLDSASFPAHIAALYAAKQDADKQAKVAKEAFESAFTADLVKHGVIPTGRAARFGYNWGKLSMANPAKHTIAANGSSNGSKATFDVAALYSADKRRK